MARSSSPSRAQLWLGLTRPRTLLSGVSSVLVALFYALSLGSIDPLKTALLLVVAISAQIGSNIANDLIDFKKGADTDERTGPLRPLSKGLLTEGEVRRALYLSLAVFLVSGLTLIALSSWWLLLVGLAVGLGIFAYSGGPYPLSYHGWGDAAVLVFFGWVPTVTSFYILRGYVLDQTLWQLATAIGLSSVNILVVNNYRDVAEDSKAGKRTLIVRMGQDFAPRLYLTCGLLSMGLLYTLGLFQLGHAPAAALRAPLQPDASCAPDESRGRAQWRACSDGAQCFPSGPAHRCHALAQALAEHTPAS